MCYAYIVYVDTITKKVGNKVYTRYLIRDSHWENRKVKHRTIMNLGTEKSDPEDAHVLASTPWFDQKYTYIRLTQ